MADSSSLNMQLLRSQLRGVQVLDALLIQKQGSCNMMYTKIVSPCSHQYILDYTFLLCSSAIRKPQ